MRKVLFIGGTGQISLCCVEAAIAAGDDVSVYNRGRTAGNLPKDVHVLVGDYEDDAAYAALGHRDFDVVCQFIAFGPEHVSRDLRTFRGSAGQYIFISSASAYQKPVVQYRITEAVPLINPFWEYSQRKIAGENVLREQTEVPYTIVRPSHTVRTRLRTLTRCEDFAPPFVRLFANKMALGEDFHITSDHAFTWDQIYQAIGRGVGAKAELVHVPSETLVRFQPDWIGPLLGDKIYSVLFDNSKLKAVVGDFDCEGDIDRVVAAPCAAYRHRQATTGSTPRPLDPLFDRIISEQRAVGLPAGRSP
jgi:nucleoside-diphosphate-sugar epimerase